MSTTLAAGTATSGAALSSDTSGILQLQSGSTPTTALTIGTNQVASFSATSMAVGLSTPNQTGIQIGGTTNPYFRSTSNGGSYTGFDFGQTPAGPGIINMRDNYGINFFTNATQVMTLDNSGSLTNTTSSTNWAYAGFNSNSNPSGIKINYSNAHPNTSGTSNPFLYCTDTSGIVAYIAGNGGLSNFSANNTNLSDATLKKDITPAKNYLNILNQIPVVTFLFNNQTDNELNLGVTAQSVQAVAPELVGTQNVGSVEEPNLKLAIYETDLKYAMLKAIQELSAKVTALEAKVGV